MGIARRIAHVTYRSGTELDERFGRQPQGRGHRLGDGGRYAVESYLDHHGGKLSRRFDANSYLVLTEAMNSHDVGRDRGGVAAALRHGHRDDHRRRRRLRPAVPRPAQRRDHRGGVPGATQHTISSAYGHDGFLIEIDQVGSHIRDALR